MACDKHHTCTNVEKNEWLNKKGFFVSLCVISKVRNQEYPTYLDYIWIFYGEWNRMKCDRI